MKKICIILPLICSAYVCYPQVVDDFSDDDFINNPIWTPDNANNWTVVSGQLRSNSATASSSFYITTPSSKVLEAQWNFYVLLQFNTSGLNFVDVYLASQQADLLSPTNSGYFVRIGGTPDEISLYKMTAGVSTLLINGTDGITNRTNNPLRIKVIRDDNNVWSLERDASGGTNYVLEGTVIDNSFSTSNFFGIRIQQSTATFFNRHFFDDIYVGDIVVEKDPPVLSAVDVLSNTQLSLLFNEALNTASAETTSHYSVSNNIGNPILAKLQPDGKTVQLTFSQPFSNGVMKELEVAGVQDLVGNLIIPISKTFLFFQPLPVNSKDIIFTEIFADPSPQVGLPEVEFIEIYNRSANPIDLIGWKFSDGTSVATLPSRIILPNQYWIICGSSNASLFSGFGNTIGVSNFPTLNNAGESLTLKTNTGLLIDSLNYSLEWYRDKDKQEGGWSLELIDTNNPCGEQDNWTASQDETGGTPGRINSVNANQPDVTGPKLLSVNIVNPAELLLRFDEKLEQSLNAVAFKFTPNIEITSASYTTLALREIRLLLQQELSTQQLYTLEVTNLRDCNGNLIQAEHNNTLLALPVAPNYRDILITEIFPDPSPQVGLPDAEFIEIHNRSAYPIDLTGWTISDGSSLSMLPSHIILPGQYWIICSTSNKSSFIPFGNTLGVSNFPTLNNAGESLTLKTNTGLLIDSINYALSWYRDENKREGGWTLELINLNNLCQEDQNWMASIDAKGGTPGKVNSVNDITPDTIGPKLLSVSEITSTELILTFDERLTKDIFKTSFIIIPSIEVSNVSYTSSSLSQIKLTLSNTLQTAQTYTIEIKDLHDCNGNLIQLGYHKAEFALPMPAAFRDVLITEIFADPSPQVGLPDAEFIEIYNRSNNPIDLKNWKFSDGSSIATLPSQIIQPKHYWIICANTNVSLFSSSGNTLGVSNFPTLNNTGESLTLKNNSGLLIDSLNYSLEWYRDKDKQEGGWTLELIDTNNTCGEGDNWAASEDAKGGTPGKINSVNANKPDLTGPKLLSLSVIKSNELLLRFDEKLENSLSTVTYTFTPHLDLASSSFTSLSLRELKLVLLQDLRSRQLYHLEIKNLRDCNGNFIQEGFNLLSFALPEAAETGDVLINEILFNPRPGGVDFVEVVNVSDKYINLKKWSLANRPSDEIINRRIITLEDFVLAPGTYLALTSNKEALKNFHPNSVEQNLFTTTLPSMNDDTGSIALTDDQGQLFDYLLYEQKFHSAMLKDKEGVSLERISWAEPANRPDNWKSASSSSGFATPGYLNSNARSETPIDDNAVLIEPEIFAPSIPGQDFAMINYRFDQSALAANIKVMDHQGRLIKEIANNETLGYEGFFRWDGDRDDGSKARMGYYFVWFEVFDLGGMVKTYRKRVVIGR